MKAYLVIQGEETFSGKVKVVAAYTEEYLHRAEQLKGMLSEGGLKEIVLNPEIPRGLLRYEQYHIYMDADLQCTEAESMGRFEAFPTVEAMENELRDYRDAPESGCAWVGNIWERTPEEAVETMQRLVREKIAQEETA